MLTQTVSKQTQKNWWTDAALFVSAVAAALSGIYFLFLPSNGFQGGRNPMHNVQILFSRETWDALHTWGGVAMIVMALIHIVMHWSWFNRMIRRTWSELTGKCGCNNPRGRWNLVLDVAAGVSFVLTAISGVYFLFVPGERWATDPMILFSRATWDLIHTWAGVVLIAVAVIHFAIHWKWVVKVTKKIAGIQLPSRPASQTAPEANL